MNSKAATVYYYDGKIFIGSFEGIDLGYQEQLLPLIRLDGFPHQGFCQTLSIHLGGIYQRQAQVNAPAQGLYFLLAPTAHLIGALPEGADLTAVTESNPSFFQHTLPLLVHDAKVREKDERRIAMRLKIDCRKAHYALNKQTPLDSRN